MPRSAVLMRMPPCKDTITPSAREACRRDLSLHGKGGMILSDLDSMLLWSACSTASVVCLCLRPWDRHATIKYICTRVSTDAHQFTAIVPALQYTHENHHISRIVLPGLRCCCHPTIALINRFMHDRSVRDYSIIPPTGLYAEASSR